MPLVPVDVIFDSEDAGVINGISGNRDQPSFVMLPAIEDCVGFSVIDAKIPFTYHVFDSTCNKFILNYNSLGDTTCAIAPGTYTSSNIAAQITSAIRTAVGPSGGNTPANDLVIYVDNTTLRLVIYSQANLPFNWNITGPQNGAAILGFVTTGVNFSNNTPFYDNNEVLRTVRNVQGVRAIKLSGPAQMYLQSDFSNALSNNVRSHRQSSQNSLIAFWDVDTNYQGTISFEQENPPPYYISKTSISQVKLNLLLGGRSTYFDSITNSTVRYLPLQGESFQVTLRFWQYVDNQYDIYDTKKGDSYQTTQNVNRSSSFRK